MSLGAHRVTVTSLSHTWEEIVTRTRRWIVALIAAAGLAGGTATAVTAFASASAAPAHASAYVYSGAQPGYVYNG